MGCTCAACCVHPQNRPRRNLWHHEWSQPRDCTGMQRHRHHGHTMNAATDGESPPPHACAPAPRQRFTARASQSSRSAAAPRRQGQTVARSCIRRTCMWGGGCGCARPASLVQREQHPGTAVDTLERLLESASGNGRPVATRRIRAGG